MGKSLFESFNFFRTKGDLRQYDIVVQLGVENNESGKPLLYVSKDGEGQIIEIEPDRLHAFEDTQGVQFLDISSLTPTSLSQVGDNVAGQAFSLYTQSRDMVSHEHGLPQVQDPKNIVAANLPALREALHALGRDIGRAAYYADPQRLGPRGAEENSAEIDFANNLQDTGREIHEMIGLIGEVEALNGFARNLSNVAQSSELTSPEQKQAIVDSLSEPNVSVISSNDVNAPKPGD